MTDQPSATLAAALEQYAIELPDDRIAMLQRYCELLWQWNERLNLTRHTDYDKFVSRDLIDSLELSKLLAEGEEVLDVGSGGGVPGIVVGILRPDLELSLCESVQKKARVLDEIISELGLPIAVYASRAEDILDDMRYHSVTARAVGPLWKMLTWFAPHWASIDQLLAIKGPKWVDERGEARHRGLMHNLDLRKVASYPMPGTDSESVILRVAHRGREAAEV
ncbi:MAG: 16S rRNA (guanine(527)-N(7))-methyltransferase RsmG [Planctomycetales bacterium]|nr:16S rRNA (guanine(527)-N(7))-methyltransferase RsmG [Planctomycetales bacterium]